MAIRCERCGRSVQPSLEVLRQGKVIEFYRCRCGSKAALIPERQGAASELRRQRGNVFLRLRGGKLYVADTAAFESSLGSLDEELGREAANVILNIEEVNYLPSECLPRLEALRAKVEASGHHLAIVSAAASMRALIEKDAPELARTLTENEKKAIAHVGREAPPPAARG